MKAVRQGLVIGVIWVCLLAPSGALYAQSLDDPAPESVSAMIEAQNSKMSRELRRIQREIAALRADLAKPGLRDVFAGIGYIFGLFGVAAYVAARRKE